MVELGQDEYWLLNVEYEYRHDRTSREMCCLMDSTGRMNYTVEYQGNDELNRLVDLMLSGVGNDVVVKVAEGRIVSWREGKIKDWKKM